MKTQAFVPLVTHPEANSDAFGAHATAAAAILGAGIHALAVNASIPKVSNALSRMLLDTPELIRQAETASRERGNQLLALLKEKAAATGIDFTGEAVSAPLPLMTEVAADHARYYDLSLVGWEAGNSTAQATAEAVVFGSGRPTILLPELVDVSSFDHIAIAWDGSRVAARAVADAQSLLKRAHRVSVLTVVDEKPLKEKAPEERLASALRQRGVDAEAVTITGQDCPIAQTLQQTAIERGCQLLVMGGYGHSRLRDFVLGGATQGVLSSLLMPVLLSH